MAFTEAEVDETTASRKRWGKVLGVLGLLLLFSFGLTIRSVPTSWEIYWLGVMVGAVLLLLVAFLLVR